MPPSKSATPSSKTMQKKGRGLSPSNKASLARTAGKRKTPSSGSATSSARKKAKTSESTPTKRASTTDYEYDALPPFHVECPAKPVTKKDETKEEPFRGSDGASVGLETEFAIRPASWGKMKSYKAVKYNGLDFKIGDFAYFAKNLNAVEDASDEEIIASLDPLKFERENYFLGMIADARADDPKDVYLRILYAYWPEELPQGRQRYHGAKEVIMSNHMDIMDAHTITGKVEVEQIDDSSDGVDGVYWRQTLNIAKLEKRGNKASVPGVLSKLKGHCRCSRPLNPDKIIYMCRNCKLWNHEECLMDNVLEKAWEKHEAGLLGHDDDEETKDSTDDESIEVEVENHGVASASGMIGRVKSFLKGGSPAVGINRTGRNPRSSSTGTNLPADQVDGPSDTRPTKKNAKTYRMPWDPAPWEGKFSVTFDTTGKYGKIDAVMAKVVDESNGEMVWRTSVSCFQCDQRLE